VFRNVGIQQPDAGEIPKRIHTRFKTRRKFQIKKNIVIAKCHILSKLCSKDLFGMLDRFFICASYLFAIFANKAVMYCCHVF